MGTSSSYGGPANQTPLVPTWLDPADQDAPGEGEDTDDRDDGTDQDPEAPPPAPKQPPIPPANDDYRFTPARSNFTRFAKSGGSDVASLGRAISNYVEGASGGAAAAGARMGSARSSSAGLVSFLSDVANRGAREALRALDLEALAGRPITEIFSGLMDYICPDGGTIDEGIAREAFIETIADLAQEGIADLDDMTSAQMETMFELYASHAIETRICNDIGTKTITMPASPAAAARVQAQLGDFIRRGVADAIARTRSAMAALTPERVRGFVDSIYQQSFAILRDLGDAAAEAG